MKKNIAFLIFNFIGLQITWAGCAYGATHNMPLLGVYIGFTYIALHFIFSEFRIRDMNIMLIIAAIGIVLDALLNQLNILSFPNEMNSALPIPAWLMALWLVFSLMVPYSLYWLHKNFTIAAIAGAIGGSFSYFLGHKLGALQLSEPLTISVGIYFLKWGILFPLALLIVKRITNYHLNKKAIA